MQRNVGPNLVSILKVDKDCFVSTNWIRVWIEMAVVMCQKHSVTVTLIRMCRSRRKGLHFYIHITPSITADLANQLQWLLGDDALRVDFNRARIESGLNEWNKLFEKPGVKLRTIYRRK
jgi:hypothetical protein